MGDSKCLEKSLKREQAKVYELESVIENQTRMLYQKKQKYEEKSHLLQNITDTMPDGLIRFNQDGIIEFTNQAFVSLSKHPIDQVLSHHINHFLEPVYDQVTNWYENINQMDQNLTIDCYLKRSKNEKIFVLLTASSNKKENSNNYNVTLVVKDYRKIKEMQEQILLSQKLDSIGVLASGVAHEVNTPMQYVIDNLDFIKMVWPRIEEYIRNSKSTNSDSVNDKNNKINIEKIITEVPRAINLGFKGAEIVTKIVRSMKRFAASDSEKSQLYDIHKGIEDVILMTKNEWKHVAELKIHLDVNLDSCYCYLNELKQVLVNLIINASHSIKEKNKVDNREKGEIVISTKLNEKNIILSVRDNGLGIPEKNRKKIFDPFFSTKPLGKGSGQGLSISYRIIVEKHKGKLYTSSSDKWTTFHIQIPNNLDRYT